MTHTPCTEFDRHFALLLDDSISTGQHSELTVHAETCPACKNQYDWLQDVQPDLRAIGDAIVATAPEIDVIDDVLRQIRAGSSQESTVVPFRQATPIPMTGRPWLAVAAGLCIVAAAGWFVLLPILRPVPGQNQIAKTQDSTTDTVDERPQLDVETIVPAKTSGDADVTSTTPTETAIEAVPPPPARRPQAKREEVLASFSDSIAFDDEERSRAGAKRLAELARLNGDEASKLFESGGLSGSALAGIAPSLSSAEARLALLTAVGNSPEDPYLRYRLLREYKNDPAAQALARDELARWSELDDENSLVYYTEAQLALAGDPPDIAGALDALSLANGLNVPTSYSADAALARQAALIEAGEDPLTAELLGALTAGMWEYGELTLIAGDLLAQAETIAAEGDFETAAAITEAVVEMGADLGESALFSQERLAGIQIHEAATAALEEYYNGTDEPSDIERIQSASYDLSLTVAELAAHFDRTQTFFGVPIDDSALGDLAQAILSFGDVFSFAAGVLEP